MLSIVLNIITILIAIGTIVIMYRLMNATDASTKIGASDTFEEALRDPSNVIRGFYAEKREGDIGEFVGHSSKFSEKPSAL